MIILRPAGFMAGQGKGWKAGTKKKNIIVPIQEEETVNILFA